MKKHPIITSVYVLLSLALISVPIIFVTSDISVDYEEIYYIISALVVFSTLFTAYKGFIQAQIKGVSQYIFYISAMPLIIIPGFLYQYLFCVGKFCKIPSFFGFIMALSLSLGFLVIYFFGKLLAKKEYLCTFLKFLYILIALLLIIEVPLYIATFFYDYYSFDWYVFNTGDYLFGEVSLPADFIDIAMIVIPALIFALYPLKIADAEYEDKE